METRALTPETWQAWAALVDRMHGVWGGCWCMAFHAEGVGRKGQTPAGNRAAKEARVHAGTTHAALVFDDGKVVGWCQYGRIPELPRIKNRRVYEETAPGQPVPDWRITCFFTDPARRGFGVAGAALRGALDLIAEAGGGLVEGYPDDPARRTNPGFLYHGTVGLFAQAGFVLNRQIGKNRRVMQRRVQGAPFGSGFMPLL